MNFALNSPMLHVISGIFFVRSALGQDEFGRGQRKWIINPKDNRQKGGTQLERLT